MSLKKYTRLVFFGKNFLWVFTAGMIALVVWIGSGSNYDNGGRMVFTNVQKSEELQNIMVKPHYLGVDVHNRPYTVTADSGLQKDKDTVVLTNITADMTAENGVAISLNSGSGVLGINSKQLELSDGVEVFYAGYQFRTDHAHVDINKGSAQGDSPIEGQGAAGTIQAKSFEILDKGNIIHFNGLVRMLLYQDR